MVGVGRNQRREGMAPLVPDGNQRARGWCLTVYQGTQPDLAGAEEVFRRSKCTYGVFGREVCPDTGRDHLQGYLFYQNKKSKQGIVDLFWPYSPWIQKAEGTLAQNRRYCTEDGNFEEIGEIPVSSRDRFHAARTLAQDGDVDMIEDELYIKYYSALQKMADKAKMARVLEPLAEMQNIWISGPSRVGKSESWPQIFGRENVFEKDSTQWWNRYNDQPIVVLSDWQPKDFKTNIQQVKNLADIRPVLVQIKGTYIQIRPKHIIVTSNFTLRECFNGLNNDQYYIPVAERFTEINLFRCVSPADCVCRAHCHKDTLPWLRTEKIIKLTCKDWAELPQEVAPVAEPPLLDGLELLVDVFNNE